MKDQGNEEEEEEDTGEYAQPAMPTTQH